MSVESLARESLGRLGEGVAIAIEQGDAGAVCSEPAGGRVAETPGRTRDQSRLALQKPGLWTHTGDRILNTKPPEAQTDGRAHGGCWAIGTGT